MKVREQVRSELTLTEILQEKISGKSNVKIAQQAGVTEAAIRKKLKKIHSLIDKEENNVYNQYKTQILTGAERTLLNELLAPDKLKKASINNLAYAFQNIYNANRLEQGKSTENIDFKALISMEQEIRSRLPSTDGTHCGTPDSKE